MPQKLSLTYTLRPIRNIYFIEPSFPIGLWNPRDFYFGVTNEWSAPQKTIPRELTSDILGVINVNTNEKRAYGERLWANKKPIPGNSSCRWCMCGRRAPTICP